MKGSRLSGTDKSKGARAQALTPALTPALTYWEREQEFKLTSCLTDSAQTSTHFA